METSRRSLYAGVVIVLLLVVVTGHEMAPIHPTSSDESKLSPCYHPSRDFKGDCVWNDICTNICLHQDPYNFIRGKCHGFPGKCYCLSC
ncbi:hypothetical protein BDA96_03G194900 [Sorghum bicolor]|uniref:Knottins-like domain-containing protein n=2 Tax=Sorghum bicolor TaxID=4558 RepID=A0A921UN93_SORBI|nr:hypothetical protein SORBI_3003G179300 [Sorghum bicolor]KAG0537969.1 hypothetical protein BDA96_03G194900 [Sorghum bicolor]